MTQLVKTYLKQNYYLYRFTKNILTTVKSIPYILQSLKTKPIENNLILGYSGKVKGWITFDIAPGLDYLGNIKNLKFFSNNSLEKVYASHVLEHVNYHEAKVSLQEMYRVLKPEGEIFIAVPDLVNVSKLLETELAETAIDITFGANRPVKDWQPQHQYGYTKAILEKVMRESGFLEIKEFEPFLNDTS